MAAASNYLENSLLDHILATSAFTVPASVHLALFTDDPTDAGTGTEVSGNGYARQQVTFGAASSGSASNTSTHSFDASGGNFGTISHWGLYDASSAGNLLLHGAWDVARTINDGESFTVASGALTISMD